MNPVEIHFVSQRIAATALGRGETSVERIVESILVEIPEAQKQETIEIVTLLKSVREEMMKAIPTRRNMVWDEAYPAVKSQILKSFISDVMSKNHTLDKLALESLEGSNDYWNLR